MSQIHQHDAHTNISSDHGNTRRYIGQAHVATLPPNPAGQPQPGRGVQTREETTVASVALLYFSHWPLEYEMGRRRDEMGRILIQPM
jgi:hypothetical protein